MIKKIILRGIIAVGLTLTAAGIFGQSRPVQASYNSLFQREASLAKQEKRDATGSFERVISPYKSVFVTTNEHQQPRNVSLMFYSQRQTNHFTGSAKHWVNVRWLKNGQVYAYNDQTVYGPYLVRYHTISKGHQTTVIAGKTAVHVRLSKKQNLLLGYGRQRVTVHHNGQVYLNGKQTKKSRNRSFKGSTPTKGSRVTRIIKDAKRYLGVPYRYAGRDAFGGLDCASFVGQVYLDVEHRDIGGMTGVQQQLGKHAAVKNAKKGDLLFWQHSGDPYTYHVAIALGHGRLIEEHAKEVQVSKIKTRKPQFAIHMH